MKLDTVYMYTIDILRVLNSTEFDAQQLTMKVTLCQIIWRFAIFFIEMQLFLKWSDGIID